MPVEKDLGASKHFRGRDRRRIRGQVHVVHRVTPSEVVVQIGKSDNQTPVSGWETRMNPCGSCRGEPAVLDCPPRGHGPR